MLVNYYTSAPILAAVGTVWPAYSTYKAVLSADVEVMARWLQFWLVFAIFSSLEVFLDIVGAYLPFYYEAKICFFLWLSMDKFKGATFLFKKYLEPFLAQHKDAIDEQIDFIAAKATNLKMEDVRVFAEYLQAKKAELTDGKAKAGAKVPEQADKPEEPDVVDVSEPPKEEGKKVQ